MWIVLYLLLTIPAVYKIRSIFGPMSLLELLAAIAIGPLLTLVYILYVINLYRI